VLKDLNVDGIFNLLLTQMFRAFLEKGLKKLSIITKTIIRIVNMALASLD
jgi:hypothetical protein